MAAPQPISPVRGRPIQAALLANGRRLHLQDGPIDLIIEATGEPEAVRHAYDAAARRFTGLLDALCAELSALRAPAGGNAPALVHPVAQRMAAAVAPFADAMFITPMAAVAGAVADEVLKVLVCPGITRAYVNNGGDIALHLAQGASYTVGLVDRPDQPRLIGSAEITADSPVRGVATSGWRGRSFSLGIADAVTILAPTAAMADAAATVVANAVDLPEHPGVVRGAARDIQPDNDLGDRRVTRDVPMLSAAERMQALSAGLTVARDLMSRGLISSAALHLQGETVSTGDAAFLSSHSQQEQTDA
ncbi:thiamine biosynthesis protein ApbE [Rhodopseudomonas sp. AAP120]|uniref:UPF0280 family protein n=1 Tax=Rhodopseudomonas sp. AAP120 TaxID=1523430 RepID=UPI0006B9BD63|nr:UPF0280 family protein [Rhodopseudomonas sp. AAP120]KPG01982.1 thiamine biosynthesis protein ApbE [Rhodopseudomonas sp. AAP120]